MSVALYGAFSIPAYWLQSYTLYNFNVLSALYILFQIITLVLMAILNIYIPHCMRRVQVTAPSDSKCPARYRPCHDNYEWLANNLKAAPL